MQPLVEQANALLKGHDFEYAFCGGLAIDLFLGYASRKHGDIDISAYWGDRNAIILFMQSLGFRVYEMLGGGKVHRITDVAEQRLQKRNIFCCTEDCELLTLYATDEKDVFYLDFQHVGQTRLNYVEFLFNHKTDKDFLYARNPDVKQALSDAILHSDGVPYLSPEMCLLYKSTDTEREGYQSDYEHAMQKMSDKQKAWLNDALRVMFPDGHKWLLSTESAPR